MRCLLFLAFHVIFINLNAKQEMVVKLWPEMVEAQSVGDD